MFIVIMILQMKYLRIINKECIEVKNLKQVVALLAAFAFSFAAVPLSYANTGTASSIPVSDVLIAEDDFSGYSPYYNATTKGVLLKDLTEEQMADMGNGFSLAWSTDSNTWQAFTKGEVGFYLINNRNIFRTSGDTSFYRRLNVPVDFSKTEGEYEFSTNVADSLGAATSGYNLATHAVNVDYRYKIGSNDFYIGYKYDASSGDVDGYKLYPQIKIGGELHEYKNYGVKNTYIKGDDKTLTYYTYSAVVSLKDGTDTVKFYRTSESSKELIDTFNIELAGTACEFIGIQAGTGPCWSNTDAVRVKQLGADTAGLQVKRINGVIARDSFNAYKAGSKVYGYDYSQGPSNGEETFGTGFEDYWTVCGDNLNNADFYILDKQRTLRVQSFKSPVKRTLKNAPDFTATDGRKIAFQATMIDPVSTANRKNANQTAKLLLGSELFYVGYKYDSDFSGVLPVLGVPGKEEWCGNDVYAYNYAAGDINPLHYMTYRVEITLTDGEDTIDFYWWKSFDKNNKIVSNPPENPVYSVRAELSGIDCKYLQLCNKTGVAIYDLQVEQEDDIALYKGEYEGTKYSCRIANKCYENAELTLFMAAYNNGSLVDVKKDSFTVPARAVTEAQSFGFDGEALTGKTYDKLRMFIWDTKRGNLSPIFTIGEKNN